MTVTMILIFELNFSVKCNTNEHILALPPQSNFLCFKQNVIACLNIPKYLQRGALLRFDKASWFQ